MKKDKKIILIVIALLLVTGMLYYTSTNNTKDTSAGNEELKEEATPLPVDLEEPDSPLIATYETKLNSVVGKYALRVKLSDSGKHTDITKVVVDNIDYEMGNEVDGWVFVIGKFDDEPDSVVLLVDNQSITATK